MKSPTRFIKVILFSLFIALTVPFTSKANNGDNNITVPVSDSLENARTVARVTQRVYEIQNMDKTNLTSAEKKALRKELKEMKSQVDGLDSKVYLSVGAIIIIILLLILIL